MAGRNAGETMGWKDEALDAYGRLIAEYREELLQLELGAENPDEDPAVLECRGRIELLERLRAELTRRPP